MVLKQTLKQILIVLIIIMIGILSDFNKLLAANVSKLSEDYNYEGYNYNEVVGSFQIGNTFIAEKSGYYEFKVASNGKLKMENTRYTSDEDDEYYNSNNYSISIYTGVNKELFGELTKYGLRVKEGTYYVDLSKGTSLTLYLQGESPEMYEQENNNTLDTANIISVNHSYIGNNPTIKSYYEGLYYYTVDEDYYKFVTETQGTVYIDFNQTRQPNDCGHRIELLKEDQNGNTSSLYKEKFMKNNAKTTRFRIPAGTYYIKIDNATQNYDEGYNESINRDFNQLDYSFQVCFIEDTLNNTEIEWNQNKDSATVIEKNIAYAGNIASVENVIDEDWYMITLSENCTGKFKFTIPRQTKENMFTIEIFTSLGIKIDSFTSTSNPVIYSSDLAKEYRSGTYYIKIIGTDTNYHYYDDYYENEYYYEEDSDAYGDDDNYIIARSFIDYTIEFMEESSKKDTLKNDIVLPDSSSLNQPLDITGTDVVARISNETLYVGQTETIQFNQSITGTFDIYSSNEKVAYVDEIGVIHAVSEGKATIFIETEGYNKIQWNIKVKALPNALTNQTTSRNDSSNHKEEPIILPKNYSIFTNRKKYDSENYIEKIILKNRILIMKGNYYTYDKQGQFITVKNKMNIKISSQCKYYYGQNKISFKRIKKLIKRAGNNCYVCFKVIVKNNKVTRMELCS